MEYLPLDSTVNQIRLLLITPGESSLDCTLKHVSMDELPEYTALSYCWGGTTDMRTVLLNGSNFQVTSNLFNALVQLRSNGTLRLWVDSISINQQDIAERNQQMLLMGPIYQSAVEVIAWIGSESDVSSLAFKMIEDISSRSTPSSEQPSELSMQAFRSLLTREYWQRMWIVQEVVLARKVTIACGSHQTSWKAFHHALKLSSEQQTMISKKASAENLADTAYRNVESLFQMRSEFADIQGTHKMPFISALKRTWAAKATDPRDKVFALLAMVNDGVTYVPAPNYKHSTEDLCRGITLGYMSRKGLRDPVAPLDYVALLGRGCDDPSVLHHGFPSWVPSWLNLEGDKLERQFAQLTGTIQRFDTSPFYMQAVHAAGADSDFRPTHHEGVLTCKGMLVGRVALVGTSISDVEAFSMDSSSADTSSFPNPYGTNKTTFLAIYSMFLCQSDPKAIGWKFVFSSLAFTYGSYYSTGKSSFRSAYFPEFLRIWRSSSYHAGFSSGVQSWIDAHRSFIFHGRTLEEWARWMTWTFVAMSAREKAARLRQGHLEADVKHYILPDLAFMIENGMKLMITDRGHIGWAHPRARRNDVLYILKGCTVPVLLRPCAETGFYIVGDAWIQGLMRGEAVENIEDDCWLDVKIH